MRPKSLAVLLFLGFVIAAPGSVFVLRSAAPIRAQEGPDPSTLAVDTELVADGFNRPVAIANAGDGSDRLFVVEKVGRIQVVENGEVLETPFLDISDRVESDENEQGLLGLAFDPDYASNGYFYVNYTAPRAGGRNAADTRIARYTVSDDPNRANRDSELEILSFEQPFGNHDGGDLAFGRNGYLYIAVGDGGSGGDPQGHGQNLETLLGTILRIDVHPPEGGNEAYAIPEDNPFVNDPGARDEIWAYGLRNPWRIAFDPETDDLYIADVGQTTLEEIDFQPADSPGGENYGWNVMEGSECYRANDCDQSGKVLPVAEYGRDLGWSVTGGEVYRGARYPRFDGAYFYADYVFGNIWALSRDSGGNWRDGIVGNLGHGATTFGLDEAGEIYVAFDTLSNPANSKRGEVHRLVDPDAPAPTAPPPLVAEGATVQQASSGHTFTEGPAADAEGSVYFSDVRQDRIHIWDVDDGSISVYREDIVQPNGLYFDAQGRLVICDMGGRRIVRDDRVGGDLEVLASEYDGKRLMRTNDLWIAPGGGIYFSDPAYGAPPDPDELGTEQVYYIPPGGGDTVQVTDDLQKPNGLIGTPDGQVLYIADTTLGQTFRYDIEPDGTLSGKTLFAERGSDGVTLDDRGNLYLTSGAVYVHDSSGAEVLRIDVPESPSNVTFGGAERKTLFITARTGVYTLDMNVGSAFPPPGSVEPTETPIPTVSSVPPTAVQPTATLVIVDPAPVFLPLLAKNQ